MPKLMREEIATHKASAYRQYEVTLRLSRVCSIGNYCFVEIMKEHVTYTATAIELERTRMPKSLPSSSTGSILAPFQ